MRLSILVRYVKILKINSGQSVIGAQNFPLDCNHENLLIAAMANRKTQSSVIAR